MLIGIFAFLLSLILLGVATGSFKLSNYEDDDKLGKSIVKAVGIIILSIIIGFSQPLDVQRIDAGCIGLKIDRVGNSKGIPQVQPCKGWVFYNRWTTDVVEYSIRQNHVAYNPFSVTVKGGFSIDVAPSFNYAIKPDKAADIYINLLRGSDYSALESTFLQTATSLSLSNASNKYTLDSIFNNKEHYNLDVSKELNKELSAYFIVSQINPGNIPPKELADVIKNKTEAIQKAQQAELDRVTAVAQAATKMANARGDSAQKVINALADARTIQLKQQQITPEYIEYIKWSAWNGVLPSTVLGSSSNILLNK